MTASPYSPHHPVSRLRDRSDGDNVPPRRPKHDPEKLHRKRLRHPPEQERSIDPRDLLIGEAQASGAGILFGMLQSGGFGYREQRGSPRQDAN
jgi:hypothetical protein